MRFLGLWAAAAVWVVACGSNEIQRGGTMDHRRPTTPSASQSFPDGGPSSPSADSGTPSGDSGTPVPIEEGFCSGAGWSDPSRLVLFGTTDHDMVVVRADGTRRVVAPLSGTSGIVNLIHENGQFAVTE